MSVPDFQSMFLPFLRIVSDGSEHSTRNVINRIADHFKLSKEDREEMLRSGNQRRLDNRVGWARTHLKHALLIAYVRRGVMKITDRGLELLATDPGSLNLRDLDKYQEHYDWFHTKRSSKGRDKGPEPDTEDQTPEEQIAGLTKTLELQLADELLSVVGNMDPFKFEQLVVDLLFAMGYGGSREEAAQVTKQSSDEGIDGVINEDRLGLDVIYVQAKRWQASIGRKEIQAFVGALAGKQATKGVFITTSKFATTTTEYANAVSQKVILIDGDRLAELMIEYDIGVSVAEHFKVKRIDTDYFEDV